MEVITFLLVENNIKERTKLRNMFNSFENTHTVLEASSGKEALDIINQKEGKIDVILLSLNTPETIDNDLSFLKTLKTTDLYKHIPVTVISESNNPDVMYTCYQSGVSGYIEKPEESMIYVEKIKHLIAYWGLNEFYKN